MRRGRICRSTPPCLERSCLGRFGIFGVLGFRDGCLSARGTCPSRGSFNVVSFFPLLSLSEPEREDKEFLLVADEEEEDVDDDEEAAAEPP